MTPLRWIAMATLLAAATGSIAQSTNSQLDARGLGGPSERALQKMIGSHAGDTMDLDVSNMLEKSREAGLLTDWHFDGHYGHGRPSEFTHRFPPEKSVAKANSRQFERSRYELIFPDGVFVLPPELASSKGVFYAKSNTYLTNGGEWYVYLDSHAEASVFVDGRKVLTGGPDATGVLRSKIHVESGYHSVMVKFVAHAAPFQVAILPPNSGSHRKNNTPYLQAAPASEEMLADVRHASPVLP